MRTCKDCPAFEHILIEKNGCDGICHEPNPARGELSVNSDWDEQGCPFYQMYVEEDEREQLAEAKELCDKDDHERRCSIEKWERSV